jgi:hypothetical protein
VVLVLIDVRVPGAIRALPLNDEAGLHCGHTPGKPLTMSSILANDFASQSFGKAYDVVALAISAGWKVPLSRWTTHRFGNVESLVWLCRQADDFEDQ